MSIVIPGELYSSKNSRMIVGGGVSNGKRLPRFLIKSKRSKEQEKDLALILSDAKNKLEWNRMKQSKRFPFRVQLEITRRTDGVFDYVNICQNLFDSLVRAGYLIDDSARYLLPVFTEYKVDRNNPHTIITIL